MGKDLAVLPSFKFYSRLDKGDKNLLHGHNKIFFENFIKDRLNYLEHMSNIKEILLNAFIYIANMKPGDDQYNERWNYLFYWMGEKVYEKVKEISDFSLNMDIINSLRKRMHENDEEYNDYFFKIKKSEFINLKKLYDYSQNYDAIKIKIDAPDYECSREYNNYIVENHDLYNTIKVECVLDTTPYCKLFTNITKDTLAKKKSILNCYGAKDTIFSEEGRRHGLSDLAVETTPTNSGNPTAIILPVLGIFIIFFLLYKFTPLGTWIRTHFVRKKISRWEADVEETIDETLEENYKSEDDNSLVNMHNIGYNPIDYR
ncbi:PIR Superfamily Protein [Plasmodium ovale wallikeri]|uniref:PIR Superfamily Protein n=2 Tax=Plasmodium ovale TaxID=36330 RepID=A0A1A9ACH7_PLAOA|nr:PIR Superfamily Protein [Plasmodium ovale wallikeri]SBT56175.1 PIR Superfamily Protein [Plasmodium ovale wallikeri]SBT73107.1 PIR protein [Plasmodium ovale]